MNDYIRNKYPNKERRKFLRVPFQKNIKYRICYDKFTSESIEGNSQNISTGGILFKTKWPPPSMSIIAIDLNINKFRDYIKNQNLGSEVNVDNLYVNKGQLYGEVVRIREYPESGFFDVALKLLTKKDKKSK